MKLRVHYKYGFGKVKRKDFSPFKGDLGELAEKIAGQRKNDGVVTFSADNCNGFSLPAREIVLMEVID